MDKPSLDLKSGYIRRGIGLLPTQGSERPWTFHQNYARDVLDLRFGAVDDGTMEFSRLPKERRTALGASGTFREIVHP